jgi:hypothetical protein
MPHFSTSVIPSEINVYQSYNPSQVVEVQVITTTGEKYKVWSGVPEMVANCPDVMSISLELTKSVLVNKIRIMIDQSMLQKGWDEIDAVELVGIGIAGAFVFDDARGAEDTSVKSSKLQNQSTSAEYVVGLISQDDRYALTLFLPLNLKEGTIKLTAI